MNEIVIQGRLSVLTQQGTNLSLASKYSQKDFDFSQFVAFFTPQHVGFL